MGSRRRTTVRTSTPFACSRRGSSQYLISRKTGKRECANIHMIQEAPEKKKKHTPPAIKSDLRQPTSSRRNRVAERAKACTCRAHAHTDGNGRLLLLRHEFRLGCKHRSVSCSFNRTRSTSSTAMATQSPGFLTCVDRSEERSRNIVRERRGAHFTDVSAKRFPVLPT